MVLSDSGLSQPYLCSSCVSLCRHGEQPYCLTGAASSDRHLASPGGRRNHSAALKRVAGEKTTVTTLNDYQTNNIEQENDNKAQLQ